MYCLRRQVGRLASRCLQMAKRVVGKDLFGNPFRSPRPRYEASLAKSDKQTLAERAARVRWLSNVVPRVYMIGLSIETAIVLEEAQVSFVNGNFVAVIVLSAAF